jgi:hypothetical protein
MVVLAEISATQQESGSSERGISEVFASAEGTAWQLIDLLSDNDVFPDEQINTMMGKLMFFLKTEDTSIFAVGVSPDSSLEYPEYQAQYRNDREPPQHTLVLPQRFGVLLMQPEEDIKDKYHLVLEFVRAASLTRNQGTRETYTKSRLKAFQEVIKEDFDVFEELMDRLLGIDEEENLEIEAFLSEENEPRQLSFFRDFSVE